MAANKAALVQKQLHLRESCSNSTIGREGRWLIMHHANNQFYKLMPMIMMVSGFGQFILCLGLF